jgi:hypothetical protein
MNKLSIGNFAKLERKTIMAIEDVHALLKKATTDDVFRLALAKNFDKTIAAHDMSLTPAELTAIKAVNFKKPNFSGPSAASWVHIYS